MTVSSTTSRWEYTGDNSTTAFTYGNKIFVNTELEVYSDNVLQTLTTHYTVSGVGLADGGTVTYVTAPANSVKIVIIRNVPDKQSTDYPVGGSLPSVTIEDDLDRRTIVSQQQEEKLSRAILAPSGEVQTDMTLPVAATRASQFVAFDGNGGLTTAAGTSADLTPVSTFINTLLDDGTKEAAQTTLDVPSLTDANTFAEDQTFSGDIAGILPSGIDTTLNLASGLVVKYVTTATVDIDAGELILLDTSDRAKEFDSVNLTVDITASGANGLDTGSEASGTEYFIWVIGKADGTVAALLSTSATAPTMPSGYTFKGRVGTVLNNGSSNFPEFLQEGRRCQITQTSVLSNGSATSFTAVDLSSVVPSIAVSVAVQLVMNTSAATSGTATILSTTTSIAVTHGLGVTPSVDDITVTMGESPTNDPGNIWIDTFTSTQFTINCRNDPGASNLDFGWRGHENDPIAVTLSEAGSGTTSGLNSQTIQFPSLSTLTFRVLFGHVIMTTAQEIVYRVAGNNAQATLNVVEWKY